MKRKNSLDWHTPNKKAKLAIDLPLIPGLYDDVVINEVFKWISGDELLKLGLLVNYNWQIKSVKAMTCLKLTIDDTVKNISRLTNLTRLDLQRNNTVKDISMLTNLTQLDLRNNDTIRDISMLTNLIQLDLYRNNTIQNISMLTNLIQLDLRGNDTIKNTSMLINLKTLHRNKSDIKLPPQLLK